MKLRPSQDSIFFLFTGPHSNLKDWIENLKLRPHAKKIVSSQVHCGRCQSLLRWLEGCNTSTPWLFRILFIFYRVTLSGGSSCFTPSYVWSALFKLFSMVNIYTTKEKIAINIVGVLGKKSQLKWRRKIANLLLK